MLSYLVAHHSVIALARSFFIELPELEPLGLSRCGVSEGQLPDGSRIYLESQQLLGLFLKVQNEAWKELDAKRFNRGIRSKYASSIESLKFDGEVYGLSVYFDVGGIYNADRDAEMYFWHTVPGYEEISSVGYYDVLLFTSRSRTRELSVLREKISAFELFCKRGLDTRIMSFDCTGRLANLRVRYSHDAFLWDLVLLRLFFASQAGLIGISSLGLLSKMRENWIDLRESESFFDVVRPVH
jgi:hypothetical protein